MMVETGDGTNPPSGPLIKKAKDCVCCHFTTSCPQQLERNQAARQARNSRRTIEGNVTCFYLPPK
jgi:hypothetical protein